MAPAGKVDRKMKGRLQSGGAVLWFLRKNAPMPTPFSSLTPVEHFGGSKDSTQPKAEVPPRPNTSCGFALDNPQQQFLHNTVRCIGTELEEMHPAAAPLMRVRRGQSNAQRNRQSLKYAFEKHSESECDRLRHEVSIKEAEVRELRVKVQQMERWVAATKQATQKRNARARFASRSQTKDFRRGNTNVLSALASQMSDPQRSKETDTESAGTTSMKISRAESRYKESSEDSHRDDGSANGGDDKAESPAKRAEEFQQAIARQSEIVKDLRARIQEAETQLHCSTTQRKSMETGLFLAESEVLKLRALATKSEGRATELANELKRVYQDLPKVMEKRVSDVAKTTSLEIKREQLAKLVQENREEHFKFLDASALAVENDAIESRIVKLNAFIERAEDFLKANRETAKLLERRATDSRDQMGFLQDIWTKLVTRALEVEPSSQLADPDLDEGPELLLYRAGSLLDQSMELLSMEGRLQLGDSRSPSPSQGKNLAQSGLMNATQSTRVPSPSQTPSQLAMSQRTLAATPTAHF